MKRIRDKLFKKKQPSLAERFPSCEIASNAVVDDATFLEGHNCVYDGVAIDHAHIGLATYIGAHSNLTHCKIGRFCSISWNVEVIAGRHSMEAASLHPIFYSNRNFSGLQFREDTCFEQYRYAAPGYYVVIGNDVLISSHALLLDGITIGDGAIILTGAVVTKDVAPYTVVGGVPAKFIKKRFSDETIALLEESKWWDRDLNWIRSHVTDFEDIRRFSELIRGVSPGDTQ